MTVTTTGLPEVDQSFAVPATAEQLQAWRAFSAMMVILSAELDAQMQRREGLNEFEYNVMAGLSEAPGRTVRISQLAAATNGSLSRLSHLISRLEARGWASAGSGDRKSTRLNSSHTIQSRMPSSA